MSSEEDLDHKKLLFDEVLDVEGDEVKSLSPIHSDGEDNTNFVPSRKNIKKLSAKNNYKVNKPNQMHDDSDQSESQQSDEYDDDDVQIGTFESSYNPAQYDHLATNASMKELFGYITKYTPQNIELEYKLEPFIPDYIPAVGDIDAFLKILRPDGKEDGLGLKTLDEPSANQSEPAVLHLQLRAVAKQTTSRPIVIKKIDNPEKSQKSIERWIKDISDLHRSKPPPTVHYSRQMPDVDSLMMPWPPEVQARLKETGIPGPDLDCSLGEYIDIMCNLLDIPVYESRIQSLHLLFSLYSAVNSTQQQLNSDEQQELL